MSTVEAADGAEAIELDRSQPFDLIILDIIMDGIDGFQIVYQLRSLGILAPVFILSGRMADNDKVLALDIGADDYITKPFSPSVLCAKVKACLRRIELSGQTGGSVLSVQPLYLKTIRGVGYQFVVQAQPGECSSIRLCLGDPSVR